MKRTGGQEGMKRTGGQGDRGTGEGVEVTRCTGNSRCRKERGKGERYDSREERAEGGWTRGGRRELWRVEGEEREGTDL